MIKPLLARIKKSLTGPPGPMGLMGPEGTGCGLEPSIAPTGSIMKFAGNLEPKGWVICHGQSISEDDYPELYFILGHRPDFHELFKNRMPIPLPNFQEEAYPLYHIIKT